MARKGKLKKSKTKDENSRPFRPRRYKVFMLIVCEDQNTEPYYFRQFKQLFAEETVFLKEIGTGKKPLGIVKQAIAERQELSGLSKRTVDFVWVVFDKDDEGNNEKTLLSFDEAWNLAKSENIEIAFSNEVFELWLLLHFCEVSSAESIPRSFIYARLGKEISSIEAYSTFVYDHKKSDPEKVIGAVMAFGNESTAIERAEKLLDAQKDKQPIKANPSTTVHLLVKKLRELIEYYQ